MIVISSSVAFTLSCIHATQVDSPDPNAIDFCYSTVINKNIETHVDIFTRKYCHLVAKVLIFNGFFFIVVFIIKIFNKIQCDVVNWI